MVDSDRKPGVCEFGLTSQQLAMILVGFAPVAQRRPPVPSQRSVVAGHILIGEPKKITRLLLLSISVQARASDGDSVQAGFAEAGFGHGIQWQVVSRRFREEIGSRESFERQLLPLIQLQR